MLIMNRVGTGALQLRRSCLDCNQHKHNSRNLKCGRCLSTRKERYEHVQPKPHSTALAFPGSNKVSLGRQLQPFISQNPNELRSIKLFFLHAVPQLSGYFQESFWRCVLQLGLCDDTIRLTIIACSIAYEREFIIATSDYESTPGQQQMSRPIARNADLQDTSLHYYNKAIRLMLSNMRRENCIAVPAITCLLFVCFEFLQHDICTAVRHINGGIKMIEQARASQTLAASTNSLVTSTYPLSEMEQVESVAVPIFSYLNVTAFIFGQSRTYFFSKNGRPETPTLITAPMQTIDGALISLLDLTNLSTKWYHEVGFRKYTFEQIETADYIQRDKFLRMYDMWKRRFDYLEQKQGQFWIGKSQEKKTMLRLMYLTLVLLLSTSCSVYEEIWDHYKPEFEELLCLAKQVLDACTNPSHGATNHQRHFSFELGIIPALEIISRKCRYSRLRREAIRMLKGNPKRECLFDSIYSSILDERAMALEEMALNLAPGQMPLENQLPPEHSRIHITTFDYKEARGVQGWPVRFFSKPRGPFGDWFIREEILDAGGSLRERSKLTPEIPRYEEFNAYIQRQDWRSVVDVNPEVLVDFNSSY